MVYQDYQCDFLDKSQKNIFQNLDFPYFFVVEKSPWKTYWLQLIVQFQER